MNIKSLKNFPMGIKDQIKRQIKAMIDDNSLTAGEMLLSAKDMGRLLNISQKTVVSAYQALEREGFLKIIKGSGTFVRETTLNKSMDPLKEIFHRAYEQAVESGYSTESINRFFITELLEKSKAAQENKKIILVDSTYEVLKTLDEKIKNRCDIDSHFMLIQDIENIPDKFLKRAKACDLILCSTNHMESLKKISPDLPVETIGFRINTDFQTMNQVIQLPDKKTHCVDLDIDPENLDFILSKLDV
ncbi:winged helix-turn-helix domain-containing protein [Desulfobacula sp.]|uniref:GntR family transcriptional regulator n=1 Tax=Desulfobacula sp. TaxID=2593537 RepID=UPI0026124E5E|nr:winged helix-turn-helix domain-containing protein [Desulfobacula sp.]